MSPEPTTARHVVLVGLPGAGKTSIGRELARLLGRPFADTDQQVELAAGTTIARLAADRGETGLLRLEQQALSDLVLRFAPLVIAAPGAMPLDAGDRALLARTASVVRVHGPLDLLARLGDPGHRPRLAGGGHLASLRALDAELAPVYAQVADHLVDIGPFHTTTGDDDGGGEPRQAIARHIADLLDLPEADLPPLPPTDADLPARYGRLADVVVDATPSPDGTHPVVRRLLARLATLGIHPR